MLYDFLYENNIRIRIWIDELPIFQSEDNYVIDKRYGGKITNIKDRQVIIELKIPRNANNYGLLGVKYRKGLPEARVHINVSTEDVGVLEENISLQPDTVFVGIPVNYANGILRSVKEKAGATLNGGEYWFNVGAHGLVGSSERIFYILTNILLKLLPLDKIESDEVEKIILAELC